MNRRDLLRLATLMTAPTPLLLTLQSCGGGGGSSDASTPVHSPIQPTGKGLGLKPASQQTLSNLNNLSLNTTTITPPSLPSAFSLADTADLTTAGFTAGILPIVGDQGSQGSCVAWGCGYAMATAYEARVSGQGPSQDSQIASPADLYASVLHIEGSSCDSGTQVHDALDICVITGVAPLSLVPYSDSQCSAARTTPVDGEILINGYATLAPTDVIGIKNQLRFVGFPMPIAMSVYNDFWTAFGFTGIYSYSASSSGAYVGAHCVAIVGYDDSKNAFLLMNSWGTEWGDNGFIWMDYETFQQLVLEVYSPVGELTSKSTLLPSSAITSSYVTMILGASTLAEVVAPTVAPYNLVLSFGLNYAIQVQSIVVNYVDPNPANSFSLGSFTLQQYARYMDYPVPISATQYSTITDGGGYISATISGATPTSTNFGSSVAVSFVSDTVPNVF